MTYSIVETNFGPASVMLLSIVTNPFNPSTQIEFALPKASHVKLEIYNALGE